MPEICIFPASGEPLHFKEAKNDRRIDDDDTDDDAKIKSLISAARIAVETRTRQQLLHARWKLVLDRFPGGSAAVLQNSVNIPGYGIRLPHTPLVRVVSIDYLDMSGVMQTMPATDYVVSTAMTPAVITPVFGKIWPIPMPQIASVSVTYEAGYASPMTISGASTFKVVGPVTWAVGASVNFYNSGGVLPAPLDAESMYTIASASNGTYTLTDATGAAVAFANPGMGRHFIGVVPEGLRSWMLLRVGSLYENREEAALLNRGKIEQLPWIDSLLEPYMSGVY